MRGGEGGYQQNKTFFGVTVPTAEVTQNIVLQYDSVLKAVPSMATKALSEMFFFGKGYYILQ